MSMTFSEHLRVWFLNLRYVVPALSVFMAAALLQHPATILLLFVADALPRREKVPKFLVREFAKSLEIGPAGKRAHADERHRL